MIRLKRSFHKLVQTSDGFGIIEKRETSLNPPLVIPAVLIASGITLGNIITSYFYFTLLGLVLFLFLYYKKLINSKRTYFIFLFFFLFGFISIIPYLPKAYETKLISEYFGEKNLKIFGMVVSKPQQKNIRTKFVLKINKIKRGQDDQAKKVSGRIELYSYRNRYKNSYQESPQFQYGDLISFTGSITKPRNFSNPGGFDYVKYLSFQDITGISFINSKKITPHPQNSHKSISTTLIRKLNQLRGDFSQFINESTDNFKAFSILCALTTGIKDYIPGNLRDDFSKSGASHILAISGLHLSIVAAISFFIFNFLISSVKPLLMRGLSGKFAALATLLPLLSYALLSGFSPSTRRAFIMIAIYMFSFVIEREKDVLNSLAAAALIILIIDPCALFAISFQLSFSAVLFIILGIYVTRDTRFFKKKNLLTRFSMFILVSFCAGIGTLPLVMHYFNIVSLVQLATNLIIIPVVGFIVVPLGLAAFFAFPFSQVISGLLIKMAIPFLSFSISYTEYLSSLSFTWARCVTPHVIEIICYYAILLGIAYCLLKKSKKGIYVIVFSFLVFLCYSGFVLKQRYFNGNLRVTILDVGQGSSALIEGPKGTRILVDGGGFSYSSTFDTGKHLVAPFLWDKKITTLDAVILTHPERDHMNGLIYIVDNFSVKKFIKNTDTRETRSYIDLIKVCSKKNIPIAELSSEKNQEIDIGALKISFVYPVLSKKGIDNLEKNDYNNKSLVFKVQYKGFKILFPGDIMRKTEKQLALTAGQELEAHVLIAPHHGSSTSSSSSFLDKVKPESIIISCGFNNRYSFPDNKVIARYNARHINFYRTDYHGAVKVVSDGEEYNIEIFKGD